MSPAALPRPASAIFVRRDRRGRVIWGPALRGHARAAFRDGLGVVEAAQRLRVPECSLRNAVVRHGLGEVPADLVTVDALTVRLDLVNSDTHRLLERRGIPRGRWLRQVVISEEDAQRLEAERPRVVYDRPAGYLDIRDLAHSWRLSETRTAARLREASVPHILYRDGLGGSDLRLFDPWVARAAAPGFRVQHLPQNQLSGLELAELAGRTRGCITYWVSLGMPTASVTSSGLQGFLLPAVLAWLDARPGQRQQRAAQNIRRALNVSRRAA